MIKLADLEVNKTYTIPLVVLGATARETKTGKPFLSLEMYDGTTRINGNYWDWRGSKVPENNLILNVTAQVTEWQGAKQLTIKSLSTNTELHITDFTPTSGVDIATVYQDAYALASSLQDNFLRALCLNVLETYLDLWVRVPGAVAVHHAYMGGTLIHCLSVARIARAIAEQIPEANVDLATAGGLLHDVGKLFSYDIQGLTCEMTDEGILNEHILAGAECVREFVDAATPQIDKEKYALLRHIILSHHGTQEHGAVVNPLLLEAHIVFHADSTDAVYDMIKTKSTDNKWTERIWALNNRPQLSINYTADLFD